MSIRPLCDEIQEKAIRELNEVPSSVLESIKHIKTWATKQPHLNIRNDDQWILNFLRGCKFNLQKTKEKLDIFYTMRSHSPEFFYNRNPFLPEIQEILNLGLCIPLPQSVSKDGPRIILLRAPIDHSNIVFANIAKTCFMVIDILLNEDDNFIIAGQHLLVDCLRVTLNHLPYLDLRVCKKASTCLQKGYPIRPKGIFIINTPTYVETIFNTLKSFLTKKLKQRVYMFNKNMMKNVHKSIPLSVLPKEYGGDSESLKELTAIWKKKVESYSEWFTEDARYGSDEMKRLEKINNYSEIFGMEGSFRKMEID